MKRLFSWLTLMSPFLLFLGIAICSALVQASTQMIVLLPFTGNVSTGSGFTVNKDYTSKTYQSTCIGSGAGTSVVAVEGSNDGKNWDNIGTISLTCSTTSASGSFTSYDRYLQVRGNATTFTGTGTVANLTMGY